MATTINGSAGVITNVGAVYNGLQLQTAKASTSGTSVDFSPTDSTGPGTWVKRITVMFNGVSANGQNSIIIQIGSGSYTTSGYNSSFTIIDAAASPGYANSTFGFFAAKPIIVGGADIHHCVHVLVNITGNTWCHTGSGFRIGTGSTGIYTTASVPLALSGTLDRLRIIGSNTGNPVDTFDAGSINVIYE